VAWFFVAAVGITLGLGLHNLAVLLLGYALFLLFVVNLVLAVRQTRRLKGTRRVERPIVAGCPVTVEVTLTCRVGRRRGLDLKNDAPDTTLFWSVPALEENETFHGTARLVLRRRGRQRLGDLLAASSHPYGLLHFAHVVAPAEEVLVLPALGRLRRDRLRRLVGGVEVNRPIRNNAASLFAQDEIRGLRDYRPGDGKRSIHWRTSARVGRLMVREFDDPPGEGLLVVLDPTPKDKTNQGLTAFEEAVSLAATLCWESRECRWLGLLLATAKPVALGGPPDRALAVSLLEALAVVEGGPRAEEGALRAALADLPPAAVLLVACGPSPLEAALQEGRRRRVIRLDPAEQTVREFYDPPEPTAAEGKR
jgi:uncharacterized protein (DUF58 family)